MAVVRFTPRAQRTVMGYRIIQEALTNVVKHAATPDCRVTIDYRDGELGLEIIDDGHAAVLAPAGPGTTPWCPAMG